MLYIAARAFAVACALASCAACADFTGYYDVGNWDVTLTGNPPGGGPPVGLDVAAAPGSITLVGGDGVPPGSQACWNDNLDPQRLGCAIFFTRTAPRDGVVSFHWAYETIDSPFFDAFGYVAGGVTTLLADPQGPNVQNGSASFNVSTGQVFGFWLDCGDCGYGGAAGTIRGFSAPVPEPGSLALLALALVLLGAARTWGGPGVRASHGRGR